MSALSPNAHAHPKACMALIRYIFQDYTTLFRRLAPGGWINSPYIRFFHPTSEQQYDAYRRWVERLSQLDGRSPAASPARKVDDFPDDDLSDVRAEEEFLNVLGLTVYDVFSDGHQVVGPQQEVYHLGSARGSGKFIADFFTYEMDQLQTPYDYLDFYMGSVWINQRGDLGPFYRHIFERLKAKGCDWIYHFPQLYLMDFNLPHVPAFSPAAYDPEVALQEELRSLEVEQRKADFQRQLDQSYEAAWEEAQRLPPVPIVAAYEAVYGALPLGHPRQGPPPGKNHV